ncbi:longitudinals lacking protein, isoforms H/M/V [Galendromus occidentalis]|uniref:Longitudinals lacking protein, isoforms H/M/V n=1 Tax=Galendromus occidentalis TaxID=34638 RepID=A0AAJ6QUN7_9ACAR|nr:longitudinals lacking protein, isoforms H/M/V [Galendromus occidentalis]
MGTMQEYQAESIAHNNLFEKFQEYYSNEEFLDTTLVCKDGSARAHKIVIASQSKFFEEVLLNNPCKHPVIVMLDMDIETLKCLVDYMYHGKVSFKAPILDNFVKAANILGLNSVIQEVGELPKPETQNAAEAEQNMSDNSPLEVSEMMADGQLVQMQAIGGGDEENSESFAMDSGVNSEALGGSPDSESPSSRTIVVAKRKPIAKSLSLARTQMNSSIRTAIRSSCPKKRFDIVALRNKPLEASEVSFVPRKEHVDRIEAGLIAENPGETLDDVVSVHYKVVADPQGVRTHQCMLCPHTATFPSNMKRHIMAHLGIKPFKCAYCDFQSTLRGDLTVHLKKRHPQDDGHGMIILK